MGWMEQEQERGITITSAASTSVWDAHTFNIVDPPGQMDFTLEVERSLGAAAVLDGMAAVEPQSETAWRQACKHKVLRVCFVNKMDREGTDFYADVQMMADKLGTNPVPVKLPVGKGSRFRAVFDVAEMKTLSWTGEGLRTKHDVDNQIPEGMEEEQDEKVPEAYLESGETTPLEDLQKCIREGTLTHSLVPVLCGAAFKDKGVQPLLDAVCVREYLPSPVDLPPAKDEEEEIERKKEPEEKLLKVAADTYILMVLMHANKRKAQAGDIIAVVGQKDTTGDALSAVDSRIATEKMEFPEFVTQVSCEPSSQTGTDKTGIEAGEAATGQAIQQIDGQKQESVRQALHKVSQHFRQVFSEMFPGGIGQLHVTRQAQGANEESQGQAQSFLSMNQLSEGQKTLVVLGWAFTIQRLEIASFCLLDEVDAALEASYRTALANLIARMAKKSQVIMTTTTDATVFTSGTEQAASTQ
ncbi:fusA [Symbiodinium sp. CCMP2592]|nr:fusA [Symbiodinium sp. CCMP2592]